MRNYNDKKKIMIIVGITLTIIALIVGFMIAWNNLKEKKGTTSTSSSATDISSKYENIDYGKSETLEGESITSGGSYEITGTHSCITINTTDDVQLVLNNAEITCTTGPAINVVESDNVSIVLNGESTIKATTTEDLDGAIYSKADLVFSGDGKINVTSNFDGIVSKDTLVFKGGNYNITSDDDGIRGKDNVAIVDGTFTIKASGDGIKSTNEEDSSKGYVAIDGGSFEIESVNDGIEATTELVIKGGSFTIKTTGNANTSTAKGLKAGTLVEVNEGTFTLNTNDDGVHSDGNITINKGTFTINTKDDGVHADGLVEINDGTLTITGSEGIEATYVKLNGGTISINASDDGINAGNKSNAYSVTVEINGGNITINMGQGDTDGIDSNGNLYINGGIINITAQSPFDYDGEAKLNGGTLIVNGSETTSITNQMMGGGGMMGGDPRGGQNRGGRR